MTGVMEAKPGCKVCTSDILNAFIQTKLKDLKDRIFSVLQGLAAESLCEIAPFHLQHLEKDRAGKSVLILECTNVICRTLKAALLFHKSFKKNIEAVGFVINPCDRCTAKKL